MAHRGDVEQRIEPAYCFAGDCQRLSDSGSRLSQASAENALTAFLANSDQFGSRRADARNAVIVVCLREARSGMLTQETPQTMA